MSSDPIQDIRDAKEELIKCYPTELWLSPESYEDLMDSLYTPIERLAQKYLQRKKETK